MRILREISAVIPNPGKQHLQEVQRNRVKQRKRKMVFLLLPLSDSVSLYEYSFSAPVDAGRLPSRQKLDGGGPAEGRSFLGGSGIRDDRPHAAPSAAAAAALPPA